VLNMRPPLRRGGRARNGRPRPSSWRRAGRASRRMNTTTFFFCSEGHGHDTLSLRQRRPSSSAALGRSLPATQRRRTELGASGGEALPGPRPPARHPDLTGQAPLARARQPGPRVAAATAHDRAPVVFDEMPLRQGKRRMGGKATTS
jgi:hypothetical protein